MVSSADWRRRERRAEQEGMEAYLAGESIQSGPYKSPGLSCFFHSGWKAAEAEYRARYNSASS